MLRSGSIEELKSIATAGDGFANTNLYYVFLPRLSNSNQDAYSLGVLCSSVQLPSRQLASIPREIGVDKTDVAYGFVNPNVSMTFRVLNDQGTRDYFEAWQASTIERTSGQDGRYQAAFPNEYMRQVEIFQLKQGQSFPVYDRNIRLGPINFNLDIDIGTALEKTYKWKLEKAYPISIQYETLTDESQNQISSFTVEFAYRNWTGEKIQSNSAIGNAVTGILGAIAANT